MHPIRNHAQHEPLRPAIHPLSARTRNKSLFASFSSEKEDSSFFEKKEAKKLLCPGAVERQSPSNSRVLM
jgi:hypothetical protein